MAPALGHARRDELEEARVADRHVGPAGEVAAAASGAISVGSGGSPTAITFVTGCADRAARSGDQLGARAQERRVVVGARVVGAEDEPLEVVDVRVEPVLATRPARRRRARGRGGQRRWTSSRPSRVDPGSAASPGSSAPW